MVPPVVTQPGQARCGRRHRYSPAGWRGPRPHRNRRGVRRDRQPGRLARLLSYPVFVGLAYAGLLVANVLGWNRRWRFEHTVVAVADGHQLNLWLRPKSRVVEYWTPDVDCRVYPPGGSSYAVAHARFLRGSFWTSYPDLFVDAPPVVAGQYEVEWLEEHPADRPERVRRGGWREILTHRVTV